MNKQEKEASQKIKLFPASLNIVNTIVGGGTLEMPFVMKNFGIFLSLFIFVFVYYITLLSLKMLLKV